MPEKMKMASNSDEKKMDTLSKGVNATGVWWPVCVIGDSVWQIRILPARQRVSRLTSCSVLFPG